MENFNLHNLLNDDDSSDDEIRYVQRTIDYSQRHRCGMHRPGLLPIVCPNTNISSTTTQDFYCICQFAYGHRCTIRRLKRKLTDRRRFKLVIDYLKGEQLFGKFYKNLNIGNELMAFEYRNSDATTTYKVYVLYVINAQQFLMDISYLFTAEFPELPVNARWDAVFRLFRKPMPRGPRTTIFERLLADKLLARTPWRYIAYERDRDRYMSNLLRRNGIYEEPRMQGAMTSSVLSKLRTLCENTLAKFMNHQDKFLYASIAVDVYNIINNIISMYRGDVVVRATNAVGIVLNMLRLVGTILLACGLKMRTDFETKLKELYAIFANSQGQVIGEDIIHPEFLMEYNKINECASHIINRFKNEILQESDPTDTIGGFKPSISDYKDKTLRCKQMFRELKLNHDEFLFLENICEKIHNHKCKHDSLLLNCKSCIRGYVEVTPNCKVKVVFGSDCVFHFDFNHKIDYHKMSTACLIIDNFMHLTYYKIIKELHEEYMQSLITDDDETPTLQSDAVSKYVGVALRGTLLVATLGVSIYGNLQCDDKGKKTSLSNNVAASIIQLNSLNKAMRDLSNEVKEIVDIVQDVVVTGTTTQQEICIAKLLALNECANAFNLLEDVVVANDTKLKEMLTELIDECHTTLTAKNQFQEDASFKRAAAILQNALSDLKKKRKDVKKVSTLLQPKIEVLNVWFYGENAAGKSHFAQNYLPKKISEYLGDTNLLRCFGLNFGDQPEYWPDTYAGEEVVLHDEGFDLNDPPILSRINQFDSSIPVNLPGPFNKDNPCRIRLMMITSNTNSFATNAARTKMQAPALVAINSRLWKYRFENILDNRTQEQKDTHRHLVPHNEDYSHLRIVQVREDVNGNSIEPGVVIDKDYLCEKIAKELKKRKEAWERLCIAQGLKIPSLDYAKYKYTYYLKEQPKMQSAHLHSVPILFAGPPGTGKSTLVNDLGKWLSKVTCYKFYNRNVDDFMALPKELRDRGEGPCIVHLEDCVSQEKEYIAFYDSMPKGSVFLITSNIKLEKQSLSLPHLKRIWNTSASYLTFLQNTVEAYRNPSTRIINDESEMHFAGFGRRLGVTGGVYYAGQYTYVHPTNNGTFFTAHEGYIMRDCDGNVVEAPTIKEIVFNHVYKALRHCEEPVIVANQTLDTLKQHVGGLPHVYIKTKTKQDLVKLLNSNIALYKHQSEGSKFVTQNTTLDDLINHDKPLIYVHPEVIQGFKNAASSFRIGDDFSLEAITACAIRAYCTLRNNNADWTVFIDCGSLYISGKENIVKWCMLENIPNIADQLKSTRTKDGFVFETTVSKVTWDLTETEVVDIARMGLLSWTEAMSVPSELKRDFVNECKRLYESEPCFKTYLNRVEMQETVRRFLMRNVNERMSLWEAFTKSNWYFALKIFGGLLSVAGIITAITVAWQGSKTLIPYGPLRVNDADYFIRISKDEMHVDVFGEIDDYNMHMTTIMQAIPNVVTYVDDNGVACTRKIYLHEQKLQSYEYRRKKDDKLDQKGKRQTNIQIHKPRLNDLRMQSKSNFSPFKNDTINSIVSKLSSNMISITVQSYLGNIATHGVGLRDRLFICNAHAVKNSFAEGAKNYAYELDTLKTFQFQVLKTDKTNDIALCEIIDKSFPFFKDITKYFVKARYAPSVKSIWQLRQFSLNNATNVSLIAGNARFKSRLHIESEGVLTDAYYIHFLEHERFANVDGHCGFPIFTDDPKFNGNIIAGFHMASLRDRSLSTLVTSEYLDELLAPHMQSAIEDVYELCTATVMRAGEEEEIEFFLTKETAALCQTATEVEACPEVFDKSKWLKQVGVLEGGPCSWHNIKHEQFKAPWYNDIDIPKIVDNSCLSSLDSRIENPQNLVKLDGKPSILFTQLAYHNEVEPIKEEAKSLLDQAIELLKGEYEMLYGRGHKPLSLSQTINSIHDTIADDYNCIPQLNMDASTGFEVQMFFNINNKRQLFKNINTKFGARNYYVFDETPGASWVEKTFTDAWNMAGDGKILHTITRNALKAEVLPINKIKEGKTRVFSPRSMISTLFERRLFGRYMGSVKRNLHGHCQVGINPWIDFTRIMHRFTQHSRKCINVDFKRWDKHILPDLVSGIFEVYKYILTDDSMTPEEIKKTQNRIDVVKFTFQNELCYSDRVLFFRTVGMPSGTVLTSHVNSGINDLITTCFILYMQRTLNLTPDQTEALNLVDSVNYGDDLVITIPLQLEGIMTTQLFIDFVKTHFHLTATTPDKDGVPVDTLLTDMDFLSQKFTPVTPYGIYLPKLKEESIYKQLLFVTNLEPHDIKERIDTILRYASGHSHNFYNTIRNYCIQILNWCDEVGNLPYEKPNLYTFKAIRNKLIAEIDHSYRTDANNSLAQLFAEYGSADHNRTY